MRILIKAKPGAKRAHIKEEPAELFASGAQGAPRRFTVAVTERAVEGRANEAILRALAEHFGVPRAQVRILSGALSREKVVEISGKQPAGHS